MTDEGTDPNLPDTPAAGPTPPPTGDTPSTPEPIPDPGPQPADAQPADPAAATTTPTGTIVLDGPGIDPTGVTVSTVAVQAVLASAPEGSAVVVPGGAVIALDATLLIDRRLHLRGSGELRWVAGITNASALRITAAASTVQGVRLSNPEHLGSTTGKRNIGIDISAGDVVVDQVYVVGFQNGIITAASGEFEGVMVTNCHVLDIVGVGGGADSTSNAGEDRGDGITTWGARAIVSGNVVAALPGTDARIGIHAESLQGYEVDPGEYPDAMFSVNDNVVTGAFRRGIAFEGVSHATATGNTVAGSTWWGIAAIDTRFATLTGNTVRWTRSAADNQGSAWSPARGPIMLYRDTRATVIDANVIEISGTASCAIRLQATNDGGTWQGALDAVVSGNLIRLGEGGVCPNGIVAERAVRPVVTGNRIQVSAPTGSAGAVVSYLCTDALIADNSLNGVDAAGGFGVSHQGAGAVHVTGNRIDAFRVGVSIVNSTEGATIVGNSVTGCATGVDTYGSSGRSTIAANRVVVSGTAHVNAQPSTSYVTTRHMGTAKPVGGRSGDLLVGNGVLWVNDQGTWRSVKLA